MPGPIVNFSEGRRIQRRLHELVPGGSHTYSKGDDQFPFLSPPVMTRADGAYCWDADGNRFVDWAMGNRVIILGHNHAVVNDAVKKQIDRGLNFTRPGILEYELAEYVVDMMPVAEMVKFAKNGSDVTSAAVRLARAHTGRKYIALCREHPFFSVADWFIGTTPCNNGIPEEEFKYSLPFRYNDIGSLEALFAQHPNQLAAVMLEPVKNDPPTDGFLEKLKTLCDRQGCLLIFDEMISGIRFDLRGAHHRWGVYPHLACFGKCISNGFAFSMLAGKREVMELGGLNHDKRRTFLLSQTHGSETAGLAAAMATLKECERLDVSKHTWSYGKTLVDGVKKLAGDERVAQYVRIIGFDCNPQIVCTREDGVFWPELHTSFHEEVISHGVLIPWISITTAHGDVELELTLNALQQGMRKVKRAVDGGNVNESFTGEAVKPVFRPYNKCRKSDCGLLNPGAAKLDCCE